MAVIEKYALDGTNTIALMKHKEIYVIVVKVARIDGTTIVVLI